MPRQKKPRKVVMTDKSQRQKQKVSQNVKIVIGDQVKRAKRTYRKKAAQPKVAEPEKLQISPIPTVWSIPAPSPFSPEQIVSTIREQFNEQKRQLPILADPERMAAAAILRAEPQMPSITKSVNQKVETGVESEAAPLELNIEPPKETRPAEVIKQPEAEPRTFTRPYVPPLRIPNPYLTPVATPSSTPREAPVASPRMGEFMMVNQPRPAPSYINRATLEATYLEITGEPAPKNLKRDELAKEVNRLKKNKK